MDCNETRRLLDAHVDRELDLVRHLEIEAHLQSCPACARGHENALARQAALRERLPRFSAPAGLTEKIRASLSADRAADGGGAPISFPGARAAKRPASAFWQFAGMAAGFAVVLFAGFAWGERHAQGDAIFETAIAEHVRSLQVDHLTDVASTDQHTVKPWFAGKLSFSPPVVDLAAAGFPLAGGRLDRIDGESAAALVFLRRQHAINLFIWPGTHAPVPSRSVQQVGFNALAWSREGLNFLAVSEIPKEELARFAETFRMQTN